MLKSSKTKNAVTIEIENSKYKASHVPKESIQLFVSEKIGNPYRQTSFKYIFPAKNVDFQELSYANPKRFGGVTTSAKVSALLEASF